MIEIERPLFSLVKHFLADIKCDIVYGYSIIENRQQGRIFVDNLQSPKTVLFWHYCGFAFVSGISDNNDFNSVLYKFLCGDYEENQRRFVLLVNDTNWNHTIKSLLTDNSNVKTVKRLRFRFNHQLFKGVNIPIPKGYVLREIDEILIGRLAGRIIPSYSWNSYEAFLSSGKGYCLLDGDSIACNAFSSSIGNDTIDIGVETMTDYRMKGLATPTAYAMIRYCLENDFQPNWGCNADNTGSSHIAQSLGFEILDSHPMYFI